MGHLACENLAPIILLLWVTNKKGNISNILFKAIMEHLSICCQVLALNRGEQNKVLTLKLNVPKQVENQFLAHLRKTWVPIDAPGKFGLLCKLTTIKYSSHMQLKSTVNNLCFPSQP